MVQLQQMSPITRTIRQLSAAWEYLKGSDENFSLQHRVYHSICMATMLVICYNVPFSLAVGLYKMTLLSLGLLTLQFFFYYLSRFKNRLYTSMVIYSIIIHLFFAANFYLSSGIQGTALHSFTVSYFLIIAIAKRRHYWIWTLGNIALVGSLLAYEYYHPETINYRYDNRRSQFIDVASTYVVDLLLIFSCLTYIINNYDREKRTAHQKELAIQQLSREKSKLISMISHDFRTPLRNIQGYIHLLKRTELDSTKRSQLESELEKSTRETERLLDNLLTWTMKHLEGNKAELEPVDLADCLAAQHSDFARTAALKRVEFSVGLANAIYIKADRAMLQLIVRNLLDNALKFTRGGGNIGVNAEISESVCHLRITDTGIGINPEIQKDIFSLNVQSSFGTAGEKGVGLGLVLCREFAQLQDIGISFESRQEAGTVFTLAIPLWK